MRMITFNVNNGNILELEQEAHDDVVNIISDSEDIIISQGDFVMMINLYRYIKRYDIQNDFINPNGKNKE